MLLSGSKFLLIYVYILFITLLVVAIINYKSFISMLIMIIVLGLLLFEASYIFIYYPQDNMCQLNKKIWCHPQ